MPNPPIQLYPLVKVVHRIFKINADGLFSRPQYGHCNIFKDYETPEQAQEALSQELQTEGEFVVLPVLIKKL